MTQKSAECTCQHATCNQGSESVAYKNFRTHNVFPRLCHSPAVLRIKKNLLTLYIMCNSTIHRRTASSASVSGNLSASVSSATTL